MAAVRSIKNQYVGINAHLHSYWQAHGGWTEFHGYYIRYIALALKPMLLSLGYTAAVEPLLSEKEFDAVKI